MNSVTTNRAEIIRIHNEMFAKNTVNDRRAATEPVEHYFDGTKGDKISEKEKR